MSVPESELCVETGFTSALMGVAVEVRAAVGVVVAAVSMVVVVVAVDWWWLWLMVVVVDLLCAQRTCLFVRHDLRFIFASTTSGYNIDDQP